MYRFPDKLPEKLPANPGCMEQLSTFDGNRHFSENLNLAEQLALALEYGNSDNECRRAGRWIEHKPSGFLLLPLMVEFYLLTEDTYRTTTTIQIHHKKFGPQGVFEYQHSAGRTVGESIAEGFQNWIKLDFVTLLDAISSKPKRSLVLQIAVPRKNGKGARKRRLILGPLEVRSYSSDRQANRPSCNACLLARCLDNLTDVLDSDQLACLRLFACRDQFQQPGSDCRINGEEFPQAQASLTSYAESWTGNGFETMKQYVILQDAGWDWQSVFKTTAVRPQLNCLCL